MTYRGHVVSKTLVRARFSPASSTGQRFIYTGCSLGRFVGKYLPKILTSFALITFILSVYDSLTGKIVCQRKGHMSCVRDVAWHPTRNEIVTSAVCGQIKSVFFLYPPICFSGTALSPNGDTATWSHLTPKRRQKNLCGEAHDWPP